jgi:hypothetical protein
MSPFKKGDRVYLVKHHENGSEPTYTNVKITARKRSSRKAYRGRFYNVKVIGEKRQIQNVPEMSLQGAKPANWERDLWRGGRTRRLRR